MSAALAIVAAIAFAFGIVLEQRGTLETEAVEGDPRFLLQVVRRPVWFAGLGCQGVGWILQAIALDRGSLVVVQSLTSLSLVVALPLGVRLTGQVLGVRELLGAFLTLAGILVFLSAGQPQSGSPHPSAATWWVACLTILVGVLVLAGVGRRLRGASKALMLGAAAGLGFGLQAAVTKTFVGQIGSGLVALLGGWAVYVLIVTALTGFVLLQSALKTGVLAPAIAASNSVTLFSGVILGVAVFGETLAKSGRLHFGSTMAGFTMAIVGIIVLGGSRPPQLSASAST
jgi:drug/metabolite transporter (DMT)-like permease